MEVCNSKRHDIVVYDDGYCPVCSALDDLEESQAQVSTLESRVEELEATICDLQSEIEGGKQGPSL